MKSKAWIRRSIGGLAMGIAAAIPGVSASAIAIILKVFEDIVEATSSIFKNFKRSIIILLPIIIGAILSAIPTIILMDKAIHYLLFAIVSLFAGFMIGSIPGITDELDKTKKITRNNIIVISICLLLSLSIGLLSFFFGDSLNISEHVKNPEWYMYIIIIPVGILASAGLIVPGISGSMILLILGFYNPFITYMKEFMKNFFTGNFSQLNWRYILLLVCFALGVIAGCFLFSKLMKYLLNKYHQSTYFGIIGFIFGSIISLFVNYDMKNYYQTWGCLSWYYELIIALILLTAGIFLAYLLVKCERKHKIEKDTIQAEKKNDN